MTAIARAARLALALVAVVGCAAVAAAQESDVRKYAVDVRLEPAARAATVRATLTVWNPTDAPKRQLQLRINGRAEVRSVTVGGQAATFDVKDDRRYTALKVITAQLPAPIAGRATGDVVVEYRLALAEFSPDATVAPGETVLVPSSVWVPMINTPFVQYGANTAPFTVTVTTGPGERAVSGGALQGSGFTQSLHALPFVVSGAFDAPVTRSASGVGFEAWLPEGAAPGARAGADRLLGDAERIAAFYTKLLGPAPAGAVFRLVATDDGAGYASPSGLTLGLRAFSRPATDAETFELVADAIARLWTEGPFAVRGATPGAAANRPNGVGLVADALPRYLAVLAAGDRFGPPAEAAAFDRLRTALLRMGDVAAQVQLALATPADPSYAGLIATKGPLAYRILERETGREALVAGIAAALAAARTSGALTFDDLQAAIQKASGRNLDAVYATWFDTVTQPDIIVGVPQQSGGAWTSALRNLGTGDVTIDVVATTESGKRVTARATVPSQGFGEARFETAEKVVAVEVDPEHVIPQTNYGNDARPARPAPDQLFVEAVDLIKRSEFGPAEERLRQASALAPADPVLKAWHARALLGLNRTADAARVATEALAVEPVPLEAAAWANNVLGQVALAGGDARAAADRFGRAAAFALEASALRAALDGLVAAERAAGGAPAVDASVAKFFAEFDRAVTARLSSAQAEQFVDTARLPQFVKGLVGGLNRKWTTEILRTEPAGANTVVADTRFVVVSNNQTSVARALARLRRTGDAWRIVGIQILETSEAP
jgi:hypothetical protein